MSPTVEDHRKADLAFAAAVLSALLFTALLYSAFTHIMATLLLAALFSYALLPVVDFIARWVPRWAAVLLVGLGGVGLAVLLVVLLSPMIASELDGAGQTFEQSVRSAYQLWLGLLGQMPDPVQIWARRLGDLIVASFKRAGPTPGMLTAWAGRAGSGIAAFASGIVFVPIFSFLILRGYYRVARGLFEMIPLRWRSQFEARTQQLDLVLSGFVRGQLLVALIMATLYSIGFTLLGLPLAIVVGIAAGLGELVPYLGGAVALLFGSLLALAGGNPIDVLWVIGIFILVQSLEGFLISPWIVGKRSRLGPVTVIVALAVGAQLFGFVGLLLSVPSAAALKVAAKAALDGYRQSAFFSRRAA